MANTTCYSSLELQRSTEGPLHTDRNAVDSKEAMQFAAQKENGVPHAGYWHITICVAAVILQHPVCCRISVAVVQPQPQQTCSLHYCRSASVFKALTSQPVFADDSCPPLVQGFICCCMLASCSVTLARAPVILL